MAEQVEGGEGGFDVERFFTVTSCQGVEGAE
jgi:hypothetical protein